MADQFLFGTEQSDTLAGGDGNDHIDGLGGNDTLSGNAGADTLDGGLGNDSLRGGEGNDLLFGADGNDILDGEAGDDTLDGGAGLDIYRFGRGDGHDVIAGSQLFEDVLLFDPGILLTDVQVIRENDDLLLAIKDSTDSVRVSGWFSFAGNQLVKIRFADGTSWDPAAIERKVTSSNDFIFGTASSETLDGGLGDDWLVGNGGNDVLYGDVGNDTLDGGDGADTYLFGRGDGQDLIAVNRFADDKLQFTSGITVADVAVAQESNDLLLSIKGSTDSVRIADYFLGPGNWEGQIRFVDGTSWDVATILRHLTATDNMIGGTPGNDFLDGGAGNDFLFGDAGNDTLYGGSGDDGLDGGAGADTYLFGLGDGRDVITSAAPLSEDRLQFGGGISFTDVDASVAGNDLILGLRGSADSVRVSGYIFGGTSRLSEVRFADGTSWDFEIISRKLFSSDDLLLGTNGGDVLDGGLGNDTLIGAEGDDILYGDSGDDRMEGGSGSDTYYFGRSSGHDTLIEQLQSPGDMDTVVFTGDIATRDLIVTRDSDDLVVGVSGSSAQLTISAWFQPGAASHVERFVFGDGTVLSDGNVEAMVAAPITGTEGDDVLTGTDADDEIVGLGGNDQLDGGLGNDTLDGGTGNDMLFGGLGDDVYRPGPGLDWIYEGGGNDELRFAAGVSPDQVERVRSEGSNDLVLRVVGTSDEVKIGNWFSDPFYQVERVVFDDGTVWDPATTASLRRLGTEGDDFLQSNFFYGGLLDGRGGNDQLFGGMGNDTLDGGPGNDFMLGGSGDDVYLPGSGLDSILDFEGNDTLRFATGVNPDDVERIRPDGSDDLVLRVPGSPDEVRIANWFTDPSNRLEQVVFADGTVWDAATTSSLRRLGTEGNDVLFGSAVSGGLLLGRGGDDVLIGGAGNDTLDGGTGNDFLNGSSGDDVYLAGSGQDSVFDFSGNDELRLAAGIAPEQMERIRPDGSDDLSLRVLGSSDEVRIANWFSDPSFQLERVVFDDGTVWDAATAGSLRRLGTEGNDVLFGSAVSGGLLLGRGGDDQLFGGAGNDTLDGGTGNDSLLGGAGSDTYFFDRTSGHDLILELQENPGDVDTVVFGDDISRQDLVVTRDVLGNLFVDISGSDAQMRFNAWFSPEVPSHIERFVFRDGTVLSDSDIQAMINDPPVANPDAVSVSEDATTANLVPALLANDTDPDAGDTLSVVSVDTSGTLGTVAFDAATQTLTYSADAAAQDTLAAGQTASDSFGYTVSDSSGATSTATVTVTVTGVNDAPVLATPVADQSVTENQPFVFQVPASTFSDVDFGDTLAYGATLASGAALPFWLRFDAASRTFSGTPGDFDLGTISVRVTATDTQGASASDVFDIGVLPITGTAGDDNLIGTASRDTILGLAGNDTLDGAGGADALVGGTGNDIYIVDNQGDTTTEFPGEGTDTVQSSVSYTLSANVENLTLTGTLAISGGGNELDNSLVGNGAANTLLGGAGNDTLSGGAGNDTLDGGAGNDSMSGGAGDDTYFVDALSDAVVENANDGADTVQTSITYTLAANVENLVLLNTVTATDGTGNELANRIVGSASNNVLNGGAGADTLIGGRGDDTYVVDDAGDSVVESANEGTDAVRSSITYVLPSDVENLTLTGGNGIDGTGNSLANVLVGNAAANSLRGEFGLDILEGGGGDDLLYGGFGIDIARFSGSSDGYAFSVSDDLVRVTDIDAANGDDGVDTLDGIETIRFSSGDFTLSTDIHVSTSTLLNQNIPSIAGLEGGGYIVVWQGLGRGDDFGIFAQRYGADGAPVGVETRINSTTADLQQVPSVSALAGGGYVVAWQSQNQDGSRSGIYTQRFDSGGAPAGVETRANTFTALEQANPAVVGLAGGGYVVSWDSNGQDGSGLGVYLQRYDASGVPAGSEVRVNSTVLSDQRVPAIGALDDGGYVVAWTGFQAGTNSVFLQRYDAAGNAVGAETQVNTMPFNQGSVSVVGLANGGFVVTWNGLTGTATQNDIYARRYDAAGAPVGSEFMVNATTVDQQLGPTVAQLSDGGYVISWMSDNTDGDVAGIFAQRYAADGATVGGEFQVNTVAQGSQALPVVTGLSDGGYTIAWQSDDGSASGIYARRFDASGAAKVDQMEVRGTTGDDVIVAADGNQSINGGGGADTMSGGLGDDTYVVDAVGDLVIENPGAGTDSVLSSVTYALSLNVENLTLTGTLSVNATGNGLANTLIGNAANNVLDGAGGADTMAGGVGNDTYVVDDGADTVTEFVNEGLDTVQSSVAYVLGANVENLTLVGTAPISGTGNALDNVLTGNGAANVLSGGAGNDTYVAGAGDTVTEAAGEGNDTVVTDASWTLEANLENLVLVGVADIDGTGNSLVNSITGNQGNNILNGGTGADSMAGALGNDIYVVDNPGDVVIENLGEGTDLVQSTVSYTLSANVENLTLTGASAISGTGNALDNVLTGNSAANTLAGGDGNDILDGGTGSDTMAGGAGNDTYVVNVSSDVVVESADQGNDTIQSAVTLTLGSNVENLVLTGSSAINGTGNALNNLVRGNSANNTLNGAGGFDALEGGGGNDSLTDTSGGNYLNGGAGTDTLTGGASADFFIGGPGNDTLSTGNGADVIAFNAGDGQDSVNPSSGIDNTLSLGGAGLSYASLTFQKSGNALVLNVSATDRITFANWYSGSANRNVLNLQVVAEAMAGFNPTGGNALLDNKVEEFNFQGLVNAFDAARAANPSLTSWALINGLAQFQLAGSDTAALGGDLAYQYGLNGTLAGIGFDKAQDVVTGAGFGTQAQTLRPLASLQDGVTPLG